MGAEHVEARALALALTQRPDFNFGKMASTWPCRDRTIPRRTGVMFNAYYNFLLEFSYWPIFSQQVYSFIVGMYFLDIFIAMGLESMLCESLLIAPIDVCINVIENTMTMGAASFVDFMVSFMVGLSITMIDRLYLGPAVDTGEELQAPFNFWFIVV